MRTTEDSAEPQNTNPSRWAVVVAVGRAVTTSVTLVVVYFVVPAGNRETTLGVLRFVAALTGFALLLTWQVRSVMRSKTPWLRAIEVLATSVPLLLLLFAMTYYLLAHHNGDAFGGPLTRLDALYFTVTVFATVGFGDISAHAQTARAIVTVQMVVDLIIIGIGIRVLLGAVRIGLERQARSATSAGGGGQALDRPPTSSPETGGIGVSSGVDDEK